MFQLRPQSVKSSNSNADAGDDRSCHTTCFVEACGIGIACDVDIGLFDICLCNSSEENSSIFMRNATATLTGGGFVAGGAVTLAAGRLHLRGTTAVEQACGGFSAGGPLKVINRSTISIRHASAGSSGGGFIALNDVVIAEMSNLSISNVSAWEFGGFVAGRGLQVNNSTVSIQHAGSLKGRAGGFGTVGGPVEIVNSSTVSIQHAKAALTGGGLFSFDDLVIAEMSNLSMSNVSAGAGGGFYAQKALRVNHSTVSIQHATAAGGVLFNALKTLEGSGGGFLVGKSVQIVNSSTVSIQHARKWWRFRSPQ